MTAEMLLDLVQELVGEPIGGFYNISRRLAMLSQAQNEMVAETKAIQCTAGVTVAAGDPVVDLPDNFGQFGSIPPVFEGTVLRVVAPLELHMGRPGWLTSTEGGTPDRLVARGSEWVLVPTPSEGGTLTITYVPVLPAFTGMDDQAFRGYPNLERFSTGIAYRVASLIALPSNPTLAGVYNDMYIQEEQKMRHAARANAQKGQRIFPATARGYYAAQH